MHLAGNPLHVPPDCPARHSVSHLQTANVELGQDSAVVFLPPMKTGDVIAFKNRVFVLDPFLQTLQIFIVLDLWWWWGRVLQVG